MTREQAERGPKFEFLGPVHDDGTVAFRDLKTGQIDMGVAEFVRLANVDAGHERARRRGDYA